MSGLAVFHDRLYASTNGRVGAEVWRCQTCTGGDWQRVVTNGFGDPQTQGASALIVHEDTLYLAVGNESTGLQMWRSADGERWIQVGFGGFGNSGNTALVNGAVAVFRNDLYVGTFNTTSAGELWMYLDEATYLPAVCR